MNLYNKVISALHSSSKSLLLYKFIYVLGHLLCFGKPIANGQQQKKRFATANLFLFS